MKLIMSPPLILFVVLLWTSSAFCLDQDDALKAEGPQITLVSMKINFVVISWKKTDEWTNVTDFTVTITKETLDSEPLCIKKVICEKEDPCTFDSGGSGCPDLGPCTTFEILVEGNGTSSSLQNLISAPPAVTDGTLEFNTGSVSCSWTLPGGSNCHNTTGITIKTLNIEYPIVYLAASKTTWTQNLTACDVDDITCSIQALGGTQGVSDSENATGNYSDKDAGSLIAELTLTPSKDSMKVSWTLKGDNCSRLSGYQISWKPDNPNGTYIEEDATHEYTMGDLIPCTSYNVTVQPMSSESTTLAEPIQKNSNTNIVVLDPPSKPIVNEVGATWVNVNWTPPKPFGSLCPLEYNIVTWKFDSVTEYQSPKLPSEQNTYNITDLTPCTAYVIEILSKNSQGYSQPSPRAFDVTSDVGSPCGQNMFQFV